MENKFTEGDIVAAIVRPETRLTVRRYVQRLYYCRAVADPHGPDQVYFEREIAKA